MSGRFGLCLCAAALTTAGACGSSESTGLNPVAGVVVHALLPSTVRTLVVAVTGPGMASGLVINIPVGADSVARGTIELVSGSGRRFVISAVDTAGVITHRGDTTVTLVPGVNPPLSITLRPVAASLIHVERIDGLIPIGTAGDPAGSAAVGRSHQQEGSRA